ncbi:MAG: ribosome biogenesis GTPase YlqF [Alicyclobacillus herbarius]|uniref:ribosome biogenesis GTPase YlqF n=1 Tax=Alicyclobacillus herbarius TaxID=122960 RepID=UPI002354840A|nr:ribosome biogenesis GTPase YlqF [Alicyclobacillus herbarius]MCL6632338.1 ribosome biogenesis GTPase YlqF [Alicyclobacillus herbarius]
MRSINWFPGHMAKARREMTESLRRVDAVIELVDARLPVSSANPMLAEMAGAKPRVLVMTRTDLADESVTTAWIRHFHRTGREVLGVDARSGRGIDQIQPALERAVAAKRARDLRRGIRPRAVKAMVVGIPNVGKSSLINRLAGKAATAIGDRPGITKIQQWIRLSGLELLDTPGVLWPKLDDPHAAARLALSGAIKAQVLDVQELAAYFLIWAGAHYPAQLLERYGLELDPGALKEANPLEDMALAGGWLEQIAVKRGLIRRGGIPDTERASELVLRELQTGKLGRISLEWPDT